MSTQINNTKKPTSGATLKEDDLLIETMRAGWAGGTAGRGKVLVTVDACGVLTGVGRGVIAVESLGGGGEATIVAREGGVYWWTGMAVVAEAEALAALRAAL